MNMPKKYILFSIETNNEVINMEIDKQYYKHFQTMNSLQQQKIKDLITMQFLQNNSF